MGALVTLVFWACATGAVTFSALGMSFARRYAFIKFHGDMDEAAASCWTVALLFIFGAVVTALPSINEFAKAKRRQMRNLQKHVLPGGYRR